MLPLTMSAGGTILCAVNIPPEFIAYVVLRVDSLNVVIFDHAFVQYDLSDSQTFMMKDVSRAEISSVLHNAAPDERKHLLKIMSEVSKEYETGVAGMPRPRMAVCSNCQYTIYTGMKICLKCHHIVGYKPTPFVEPVVESQEEGQGGEPQRRNPPRGTDERGEGLQQPELPRGSGEGGNREGQQQPT